MSEEWIPICLSGELEEGGQGVRFPLTAGSDDATGFVVRYGGRVYGYLNRCAHVPIELDWNKGEFFESSGLYLICATHGAMYEPETGRCAGGPCRGSGLRRLDIMETENRVFWRPDDYIRPVRA